MSDKVDKFIGKALQELIAKGVSIHLIAKDKVGKWSGYFDDTAPELKMATGKPKEEWLPIFVHEYCHFLQWQDENFSDDHIDWDAIEEWTDGNKKMKREAIVPLLYGARDVELDCEKRTLELIRRYNLPVCQEDYTKRANSYIMFYTFLAKKAPKYGVGTWCNKMPPYRVPEIFEIMPGDKLGSGKRISKKYIELIEKHCL